MSRLVFRVFFIVLLIISVNPVYADWPMAGHDNQRTSNASEVTAVGLNACGFHAFPDYIPAKAHVITAENIAGTTTSLIFVPTAAGVYALKTTALTNTASDIVWFYPMSRPVGHSPTINISTGIIYIPSLDKTIHAVNYQNGQKIWQTDEAGGAFITNPLVANNLVYAGNRDGYFYAFNATTGALVWHYQTQGSIEYSAAISKDNQTIYFASNDMHAYALNALNGTNPRISPKFQGHGFISYWPVYYEYPNQPTRVLFAKAPNYPENWISTKQGEAQIIPPTPLPSMPRPTPPNVLPVDSFISYHNQYPDREMLLILDPTTLTKRETSPHLWWGNPTGNRYPPAISSDGKIWDLQNWENTLPTPFGRGGFYSWYIGAPTMIIAPNYMQEAGDEPRAFSLIGSYIAFGHGGDGADTIAFTNLVTGTNRTISHANFYSGWGKWYQYWYNFKYGNWLNILTNTDNTMRWWSSTYGTHGVQTPIVPLNNTRSYIHRSNAVLCLQP